MNLYVQLGHGRDYAWSATTADVRQRRHVRRGALPGRLPLPVARASAGRWTSSTARTRGRRTLERLDAAGLGDADRLPHGARHRLRARHGPAARRSRSSRARTTYFHEADSAIGFSDLNDPSFSARPAVASARRSTASTSRFNWAYVDADHIAYQLSGWYPAARQGHLAGLPGPRHRATTTGRASTRDLHTQRLIARPRTRTRSTRDYLVSWNNKQAPGWAAADDKYAYGPVYRSQMIERRVRPAIARRAEDARSSSSCRRWRSRRRRTSARASLIGSCCRGARARRSDPSLARRDRAAARLGRRGAHRRDLDGDGKLRRRRGGHAHGRLVAAAGQPSSAGARRAPRSARCTTHAAARRRRSRAPTRRARLLDGWWGYVSKDLRRCSTPREAGCPAGAWSRVYCGARAQRALPRRACRHRCARRWRVVPAGSTAAATARTTRRECFDRNRATTAAAIAFPPRRSRTARRSSRSSSSPAGSRAEGPLTDAQLKGRAREADPGGVPPSSGSPSPRPPPPSSCPPAPRVPTTRRPRRRRPSRRSP